MLIAITIVGIVTAMTIPTLISKIKNKVSANSISVFSAKLIKGLNLTKAAGDLSNTYSSTKDFLENGLGKYYKIAKICAPENTRECIPYDKIKFDRSTSQEDYYDVKKINTSKKLNKKPEEGFKDIASFVTGDGILVIASYKKDCLVDSGELDKNISECLAGIYDINGSRKPNKLGVDIQTFNGGGLEVPAVLATLGGVEIISTVQVYSGVSTNVYCKDGVPIESYKDAGVRNCCTLCDPSQGDRWAAAAKACFDMGGKLPSEQQLADIATALYRGTSDGGKFSTSSGEREYAAKPIEEIDSVPAPLLPLFAPKSHLHYVWSSAEFESNNRYAYHRYFDNNQSFRGYNYGTNKGYGNVGAFCVME